MNKENEEKPPETKIVLETDIYPLIIQRIDQYLYKKWPDFFGENGGKAFKDDVDKKCEEMRGKEDRINARYKEWENNMSSKLKEIEALRIQLDLLRRKVLLLEKKKWYQFFATPPGEDVDEQP